MGTAFVQDDETPIYHKKMIDMRNFVLYYILG